MPNFADRRRHLFGPAEPLPQFCDELGPQVPVLPESPTQAIAREGMILRVRVGSTVQGMAIDGQDDVDEMGVCLEPPRSVIGSQRFEHYTFRTQPEGVCSGPGDLDLVVYSLRKYAKLVGSGNPTTLLPLFVPEEHVVFATDVGDELRRRRDLFLSRAAGPRFKGYLASQRDGLLGLRSGGSRNKGRADIRERYGFDTKFAAHMVRLGIQGVELLNTGRITLPIPEPELTWLRDLRQGRHTLEEALKRAEDLEHQIDAAMLVSPLPPRPRREAIDGLVINMHRDFWAWSPK